MNGFQRAAERAEREGLLTWTRDDGVRPERTAAVETVPIVETLVSPDPPVAVERPVDSAAVPARPLSASLVAATDSESFAAEQYRFLRTRLAESGERCSAPNPVGDQSGQRRRQDNHERQPGADDGAGSPAEGGARRGGRASPDARDAVRRTVRSWPGRRVDGKQQPRRGAGRDTRPGTVPAPSGTRCHAVDGALRIVHDAARSPRAAGAVQPHHRRRAAGDDGRNLLARAPCRSGAARRSSRHHAAARAVPDPCSHRSTARAGDRAQRRRHRCRFVWVRRARLRGALGRKDSPCGCSTGTCRCGT